MKKINFILKLFIVLTMMACSESYDDSALRGDINKLNDRVVSLEQWQQKVNSDISTMQGIVNALNGVDYITSVENLKDSSGKVIGYKIHFANNGTKEIYHGKEGAPGKDGEPGKDGNTPSIGMKIDSDGVYYWTLDGQWLLDDKGNKVKVANGVTPHLKIEEDHWYISYDDGKSWEELGEANTSSSTGGLFEKVEVSDTYVTFTLKDGNKFAVSLVSDLSIKFSETSNVILLPNSTIEIGYEIVSSTGKVDIELIPTADLMAEVIPDDNTKLKGKIKVTALSTLTFQPKVVLLVTNGVKMLMRSIEFEHEEMIQISDNTQKQIGAEGGELLLEYFSNTDCEINIPDKAKEWISTTQNRAVTKKTVVFNVKKNNGNKRSALITIKSVKGALKAEYTVTQDGNNSISVKEEHPSMPCAGMLTVQYAPTSPENGVANMLDGNRDTYYECSEPEFTITWEGEEAIAIDQLYFYFGNDENHCPQQVWHYGSNDGINWDWFGAIGTEHFKELKIDDFTNSRYKKYRFQIKNLSGKSSIHVKEFKIIARTFNGFSTLEELYAGGMDFTYTSSTPMGKYYENKHVTTDADRTWLSTATNEPDLLPSASSYTWRPYEVNLYPFGEPLPADVNQHGVGDCSALAAFAQMAYMYPDFIKHIITDHKDGTYTVAMFDPQGKPVDVRIQSTFLGDDKELGACTGKNNVATWATVMEKAIMKWNKIYQVNPDISGIDARAVTPLFTGDGKSFWYRPNSLDPDMQKQAVDLALEEGLIPTGGFTIGGLMVGNAQTVTAHAYSVMYSTDASALYAMRNPWGNSPGTSGKEDGILNIVDDGIVPPTIDIKFCYPGIAAQFAKKPLAPYIPPTF